MRWSDLRQRPGRNLLLASLVLMIAACGTNKEEIMRIEQYNSELSRVLTAWGQDLQGRDTSNVLEVQQVAEERILKLKQHFAQYPEEEHLQLVVKETNAATLKVIRALNEIHALFTPILGNNPKRYEQIKITSGYLSYQKDLQAAAKFSSSISKDIKAQVEKSRLAIVNSDMDDELKLTTWNGVNYLLNSFIKRIENSMAETVKNIDLELEIIEFLHGIPDKYTVNYDGTVVFSSQRSLDEYRALLGDRIQKQCTYLWC